MQIVHVTSAYDLSNQQYTMPFLVNHGSSSDYPIYCACVSGVPRISFLGYKFN